MKKASGLYRKVITCQSIFLNYSKSESETLVESDIVGSSFLMIRLFHHENPISKFIRTYGCINGLIQAGTRQSGAFQDFHGSFTGYIRNERFLTFTELGKRLNHSASTPVARFLVP